MSTVPTLVNDHGLFTYKANDGTDDKPTCLGYLLTHEEHGVYDANFGKVDVSIAEAERHNQVLDAAIVKGLDDCPVGYGGLFYLTNGNADGSNVTTWMGTVVGQVHKPKSKRSRTCHFSRNGMTFTGRISAGDESVFFERIS